LATILGIWDGHDAGAALLVDGTLAAAVNEERLTRRKLEIDFPTRSIRACLDVAGIAPARVDVVAASTTDVAKAIGRIFPSTKEAYYRLRRRQARPGLAANLRSRAKYRMTEWKPNAASRWVSGIWLARSLAANGLAHATLRVFDHHACHAASAAYTSGFDSCLVVTIDGLGDGKAATVSRFRGGRLELLASTPARHSPGVFFEHVTHLLNMRELEDEGKVMALADYASPVADADNPMFALLRSNGAAFVTAAPGHALRRPLKDILWRFPNEQFAFMAQRVLEDACVGVVRHGLQQTGERRVALAGGVASNIKVNRRIRRLDGVDDVFVFPHMGDGGLALGAALMAAADFAAARFHLDDLGLGPEYSDQEIQAALSATGLRVERCADIAAALAPHLAAGDVAMWFQGRMEYGPRALGHRSVLARADRPGLRDRLNLVLKRRVWYQPFCPSLLESDARRLLSDFSGRPNRHMTMAYHVAAEHRGALSGVTNVDGSCRPQMVEDDAPGPFAALLRHMRTRVGVGALLNTSFNVHGRPLACTPRDAVDVFVESGADWLAIGPFLVPRADPR
jgi:carbamoyltransferase